MKVRLMLLPLMLLSLLNPHHDQCAKMQPSYGPMNLPAANSNLATQTIGFVKSKNKAQDMCILGTETFAISRHLRSRYSTVFGQWVVLSDIAALLNPCNSRIQYSRRKKDEKKEAEFNSTARKLVQREIKRAER